jgi:hypothetical protein
MKKLLLAVAIMFSISAVYAEVETKTACVKNEKTGKEVCKVIKVHKKLEGTPVPDKKK